MKRNKTWLAWALGVGLIAYLLGAATAGSSTVTDGETVVAYASGTALHVDAIQQGGAPDGVRVVDVEAAFSAVNVDSNGFEATSRTNENDITVQPDLTDPEADPPNEWGDFPDKNASARGSGLEVGLGDSVPDVARTLADTQSRATAPPDYSESFEENVLPSNPLAHASLLLSDARAQWENSTCLTTRNSPIAYGRGYAADVQLVDQGASDPDTGEMENPVVATDDPNPERAAVQTETFTYAVENADGNFGLVSEVHQTFAPIELGRTLVIELLGEWFVKTTADGIGPATMTYGVTDPVTGEPVDPGATVIRISGDGGATYDGFSLQELDPAGIVVDLAPLPVQIALGEDPRAISVGGAIPDAESAPTLEADGTHAAGALDVVRIEAFDDPATAGSLADVRIGHFESDLEVPAGGFTCGTEETTTTTSDQTTTTGSTSSTSSTSTTSTTAAPTTTSPGPTSSTAPPTTTPPPEAPPATPIRSQPKTVG